MVVKLKVMLLSKNSFHVFTKSLHAYIVFCWFQGGSEWKSKWKKLRSWVQLKNKARGCHPREGRETPPPPAPSFPNSTPAWFSSQAEVSFFRVSSSFQPLRGYSSSFLFFCCSSHHTRVRPFKCHLRHSYRGLWTLARHTFYWSTVSITKTSRHRLILTGPVIVAALHQ